MMSWSLVQSSLAVVRLNLNVGLQTSPSLMVLGFWEGVEKHHLLKSHPLVQFAPFEEGAE